MWYKLWMFVLELGLYLNFEEGNVDFEEVEYNVGVNFGDQDE